MQKRCKVCNRKLGMNTTFCVNCGARVPKKPFSGFFIFLVLVMVSVMGFTVYHIYQGGNYVAAVYDANKLLAGDSDMILKMIPLEAEERLREEFVYQNLDSRIEQYEPLYQRMCEIVKENYDAECAMELRVTQAAKCTSGKLSSIKDSLYESYDIPSSSVKEAYRLTSSLVTLWDEEIVSETILNLYAIKIDRKWYLLSNYSESDDEDLFFFFSIWCCYNI